MPPALAFILLGTSHEDHYVQVKDTTALLAALLDGSDQASAQIRISSNTVEFNGGYYAVYDRSATYREDIVQQDTALLALANIDPAKHFNLNIIGDVTRFVNWMLNGG